MPKRKRNKIFICFIVKANKKIGSGHLIRCKALAEEFRKIVGCNIKFFSKISLNEISNFDICITDLPNIKKKELEQLKRYSKFLVNIDDGHKLKFPSDVLVNPNLNPKVKNKFSRETKYFLGRNCIILRKEFNWYARKKKKISKKVKRIFICFGGSDPDNLTERLIRVLKEINLDKRIRIDIIRGSLFGNPKEIEKLTKDNKEYILHKNIHNLGKILWKADLAIISGGTLLYEACVLGIPSIVICKNQEQDTESRFFFRNKGIINLGIFHNLNKNRTSKVILELISDYQKRKLLSKKAKQLMSPGGSDRVARIILKEYFKKYE